MSGTESLFSFRLYERGIFDGTPGEWVFFAKGWSLSRNDAGTGAREAEGSGLLRRHALRRVEGSNPSPSAGLAGNRWQGDDGSHDGAGGPTPPVLSADVPSGSPLCQFCGFLDWTVSIYGEIVHKHACPYRTDTKCQSHPELCEEMGQ